MKKYKHLLLVSLLITQSAQASVLSDFFNNVTQPNSNGTSKANITAQINPYVSQVLKNEDTQCSVTLSASDFTQFQQDQLLVNSIITLYSTSLTPKELPASALKPTDNNKHMNVLVEKLSSVLSKNNDLATLAVLSKLSQNDMMVMNFVNNNTTIAVIDSYIKAHQSIELGAYTIDGYINAARTEYNNCLNGTGKCPYNSQSVWKSWFNKSGFGLTTPYITSSFRDSKGTIGVTTLKQNFVVNVPESEYHSPVLTKKLFEFINMYGGKNFDQFKYLETEVLNDNEASTDGVINAPGQVTAGILLKLANQRLVAFYKYQRCRSMKQNAIALNSLNSAVNSKSKYASPFSKFISMFTSAFSVQQCKFYNRNCPTTSTQVTSDSYVIAMDLTKGLARANSTDDLDYANGEVQQKLTETEKLIEALYKLKSDKSLSAQEARELESKINIAQANRTTYRNKIDYNGASDDEIAAKQEEKYLVSDVARSEAALANLQKQLSNSSLTQKERTTLLTQITKAQNKVTQNRNALSNSQSSRVTSTSTAQVANGAAYNNLGLSANELAAKIKEADAEIKKVQNSNLSLAEMNSALSQIVIQKQAYTNAQTQTQIALANSKTACSGSSVANERSNLQAAADQATAEMAAAKKIIYDKKSSPQALKDAQAAYSKANIEQYNALTTINKVPLTVNTSCKS